MALAIGFRGMQEPEKEAREGIAAKLAAGYSQEPLEQAVAAFVKVGQAHGVLN